MKNRIVILSLAAVLVAPGIAAAQYEKDVNKTTDTPAADQSRIKQADTGRVSSAAAVMRDFAGMPNGAPRGLTEKAVAVVVVPDLSKASPVVGGKQGSGLLSVKNADGSWSEPVFVNLTGFQAGETETDLVLVLMNDENVGKVLEGDFTLDGAANIVAGPIGSGASAAPFNADVYGYGRSENVFEGISVTGSHLSVDKDAIARVYGGQLKAHDVVQMQPSPGTPGEELADALKQFTGTQVAPEPATGSTGTGKSK